MGDGTLCKNDKNARVKVSMTNKEYLNHLNSELNNICTEVRLEQSGEDVREDLIQRRGSAGECKDVFVLRTRVNPELNDYREWYSSGKKVWDENLQLTPTTLKHWYCGDGNLATHNKTPYVRLAITNEWRNTDKVSSYFTNVGLPEPRFETRHYDETTVCSCEFTIEQSQELFEYMGEAPPGFEYKWPNQNV